MKTVWVKHCCCFNRLVYSKLRYLGSRFTVIIITLLLLLFVAQFRFCFILVWYSSFDRNEIIYVTCVLFKLDEMITNSLSRPNLLNSTLTSLLLSAKHRDLFALAPPPQSVFSYLQKPPFLLWEKLCLIPDEAPRPDALQAHGYALPHALAPSHFPLFPLYSTGFWSGWSNQPKTKTRHEAHHIYSLGISFCNIQPDNPSCI